MNKDYIIKESKIFDEMIKKYNLESSNYLVDLLYEALIMEYN